MGTEHGKQAETVASQAKVTLGHGEEWQGKLKYKYSVIYCFHHTPVNVGLGNVGPDGFLF
jgi:hypothetical protein